MPNEILLVVQKEKAIIQDKRMHKYLNEANTADINSTFKAIDEAFRSLYIAKGFYHTLHGLELINGNSTVAEDIERIETKLNYVKEEKQNGFGCGYRKPIKRA